MSKVDIFIVSFKGHYPWLNFALQSIGRFASGFNLTRVLVPLGQEDELHQMLNTIPNRPANLTVCAGNEWPDKGMLWHMAQIMRADEWCPGADFILHTDSDCLFTEPVTPEDYFVDGKPVLYYEKFASIIKKHPEVGLWKEVTQGCLPFSVKYETMRRHPAVHPPHVYRKAVEQIQMKTGKPMDEYISSCRNEFPNGFCEFNTLGNVAMEFYPEQYHLVNTAEFKDGWPLQKICQFWTHSPPDIPQEPTFRGKSFRCTPAELFKICQHE